MDVMQLRRKLMMIPGSSAVPIFSTDWPESVPMPTSYNTKRTFVPSSYVIGMSPENYYRPNDRVSNVSVSSSGVSMDAGVATGFGVAFVLNVTPGKSYRFDLSMTNGNAWLVRYASDGSSLGYKRAVNTTITIDDNASQVIWILVTTASNSTSTFTNLNVSEAS